MSDEIPVAETLEQKKIRFATSDLYQGAVELLKENRSNVTSLIGETEHQTVINALTVELESALIQRFVIAINDIRSGKNLERNG